MKGDVRAGSLPERLEALRVSHPVVGDAPAWLVDYMREIFALAQDAVHDCLLLRDEVERMRGER